jgi:hypothetical protein
VAAPSDPQPSVTAEIQQVVVTGTASARGTRKIDTSFSITTATGEQLKAADHAGILALLGRNWEVRLNATNLTNELGLTEGNSRLTGAQSSGPIYARRIFGRAVEASLLYRF